MSYYTGTANDYEDLLDIIVTNAIHTDNDWIIVEDERATAGKNWIILKAVGNAGTEQIFVGIKKYADDLTDTFGFILQGFAGYQAAVDFFGQAGAIPNVAPSYSPTLPLWENEIPYWLVINKRRICLVAKVSTNYEAAYLGHILAFGSTGQYPYPLCIGGSNITEARYDETGGNHSHFVIPYAPTVRLRDTAGSWRAFQLPFNNPFGVAGTFPYADLGNVTNTPQEMKETPNSGGSIFPIQPVLLFEGFAETNFRGNIYGALDGVFHVTGLNNAPENILEIGGDDYLIVQNVFRSTPQDFWALKLA